MQNDFCCIDALYTYMGGDFCNVFSVSTSSEAKCRIFYLKQHLSTPSCKLEHLWGLDLGIVDVESVLKDFARS